MLAYSSTRESALSITDCHSAVEVEQGVWVPLEADGAPRWGGRGQRLISKAGVAPRGGAVFSSDAGGRVAFDAIARGPLPRTEVSRGKQLRPTCR